MKFHKELQVYTKMTKGELIIALKKFPDDMEIRLGFAFSKSSYKIKKVRKDNNIIFVDHGSFISVDKEEFDKTNHKCNV